VRKFTYFAALLAVSAAPAHAEMSISTFLAKADALKAKGFFAFGSPDISLLKSEVANSVASLKAESAAAKKAGRRPPACVPQGTKLSSDDLMAHMRAYPEAQRNAVSVKAALYGLMSKRFPCPATR
jgi:hypothetical protein